MTATEVIGDFLRHLSARDLPDAELYQLKARAFHLMAEYFLAEGDPDKARECVDWATAALARAEELEP